MKDEDVLLLDSDEANARIIAIWPTFCLKHVPDKEEPEQDLARPANWEYRLATLAAVYAPRVRELVERLIEIGAIKWSGQTDPIADQYVRVKAKHRLGL